MSSTSRAILRQLHLWLGLTLGLLFAVIAVTGSALVFYIEIDEALHEAPLTDSNLPPLTCDSPAWNELVATARAYQHDPHGEWSFEVTGKGGAIPARYYPSSHHVGHHAEREMIWFSADGTEVVRNDPWGEYLMSWLYELHMHLLAGETGRQIVGWSGFAILFLLLSGMLLWWPRGSWRKALAFKRNASPVRRLRDLHKLSGLWSLILLTLLALTGALLALPEIKESLLSATVASPDPVPAPLSRASSGQQIPLTKALEVARTALPDARISFIDVPGADNKPFRFRMQVPGDLHQRFPLSYVFVDQYSGELLAVHDLRQGNAASTLNSWIRPLHDGSIAGLAGRILAVLIGFVPLFLFVSGLLYWRTRLNARTSAESGVLS